MKGYKVIAKSGNDTIKFELPIGCKQDTLREAWQSARAQAKEVFGASQTIMPSDLSVTLIEYYTS